MFNSTHICGKVVYKLNQGNPSGIPLTVIINSMVNSLLFRIAFLGIGRQHNPFITLKDYHNFVKIKNYGDDNIGRVNSEYVPWFHMVNISEFFSRYEVKYTAPDKKAVTQEWLSDDELSYLKRGFRKIKGYCYAPLEIGVIHEMISWYRKGNDPEEACQETYESALRELVHHGRSAYDKYQKHIHNFASENEVFLNTFKYDVEHSKLILGGFDLGCDLALSE
jgi:hypothetical protein